MRISRLYVEQDLRAGEELDLTPAAAHYAGTVLRLGAGAPLALFNGDGREYAATIVEAGRKRVRVAVEDVREPAVESPFTAHLGLGLSRGERMDWAIQKCTELGVASITPLFTEHCEVKLKGDRVEKRQAHWRQVAVSACEQSGRVRIPQVHEPMPLREWVGTLSCPLRLVFDHRQASPLSSLAGSTEAALLIGPEGGLSEGEIALAHAAGFQGIRMGPRVLRTETAPVAALTLLQYLWGDLG